MFKIVQAQSFSWPVKVSFPADGGRFIEQTFDVKFRRVSASELEALRATLNGEFDAKAFARTVVQGWAGVEDESGEMPFSATALDSVLEIQGVAGSIVVAFFESAAGAPRKN